MHVKFKITFEDNTILESHDEMYNQVKDHCHALSPNNLKKWKTYELISDEGHFIKVDFQTGLFNINGQKIHPATGDGIPQTYKKDLQNFNDVDNSWKFLNGMPYFPITGRRQSKGDLGELVIYFCGWKRKMPDGKTIQKICYFYPDGQTILT